MNLSQEIISVENLTKIFEKGEKRITALDNINLKVNRGEVLGLLGPNGAGKTTTIHHLLGLTTPTAGSVFVFGMDISKKRRKILSRVNLVSAVVSLPSNLTAYENLSVFARLYGLARPKKKIWELLELFEIPEVAKRKTGALSSGQQTRLNLCKAFLNDPEVLYLDEPTASLDPNIAAKVRETLKKIQNERRMTMVYTSHNMVEVEQMCQKIMFLIKGKMVLQGSPEEVVNKAKQKNLEEVFIHLVRQKEGGQNAS